jgi:thioredoxin-dependent peroxiredoxin
MPQLTPGQLAPEFSVTDAAGQTRALADFRGTRVIIFCYPAALTPGCSRQAGDFEAALPAFSTAGYQVVGLSPDPPTKLTEFASVADLTYPLLSDPALAALTSLGAYGEKNVYGKVVTGVLRSTFVIDETGHVAWVRYNVKATGHVKMLAKALGIELIATELR